jgi:hypothetical protein
MPTDACQYFYDCKGCGQVLRPKPGQCCVFCSYGSSPCPPIQAERCGVESAWTLACLSVSPPCLDYRSSLFGIVSPLKNHLELCLRSRYREIRRLPHL